MSGRLLSLHAHPRSHGEVQCVVYTDLAGFYTCVSLQVRLPMLVMSFVCSTLTSWHAGFLQSRDGSHYAAAGSSSSAATRFLCNMPTEFQQTWRLWQKIQFRQPPAKFWLSTYEPWLACVESSCANSCRIQDAYFQAHLVTANPWSLQLCLYNVTYHFPSQTPRFPVIDVDKVEA